MVTVVMANVLYHAMVVWVRISSRSRNYVIHYIEILSDLTIVAKSSILDMMGNLHLKFFKYLGSNIILLTISQSFASTVQKNCCEQTLRKVNITKIKPFSKRNYVSYCRYILKPKQNVFYFLGYSLIKVSYTFWFQD